MKRNNVKQITIRLTADEYAHVKQLSKDSGLKIEPAIRRLIMGVNLRPRPPDELPELLRQLSGIGAACGNGSDHSGVLLTVLNHRVAVGIHIAHSHHGIGGKDNGYCAT